MKDPKEAVREALELAKQYAEQRAAALVSSADERDPTGVAGDAVLVQLAQGSSAMWSGGVVSPSNIVERVEHDTYFEILRKRIEARRWK